METITARDNPKIKEYCKLASKKSYRDQTGNFVIEGIKLVREAILSGVCFKSLFVTQECFEKNYELLTSCNFEAASAVITEEISQKLTLQNTPQGIFAVCKRLDNLLHADTIYNGGNNECYLMLCNLQDAGNVGTLLRTAEAMGMKGVILAQNTCDVFSPKVLRGSMGSAFRLPLLYEEDAEALLCELGENGVFTYAAVADESAASLSKLHFQKPAVLLIGNEGNGLSQSTIACCNQCVTIQMSGKTESLNASIAAGILMWEMTKRD